MYEIAYKLMFRLYMRHRDQTPGEAGREAEQPEINDITEYTPSDFEKDEQLKRRYMKRFVEDLFQSKTRLGRD